MKFYGVIGFAETVETSPGVWKEQITEHSYYGDLVRSSRRLEPTDKVNDNVTLAEDISIVADPFAQENFHAMRYVKYLGTKLKVTSVDIQYPRLVLTTGGIYNENST
jgi:hypothetical protein